MKIGLDFDQTYTEDPTLWDQFILNALERGHEVYLVTFRDERFDWCELMTHVMYDINIPVYCTRGVAKDFWCQHFGPGKIDVWIDDQPERVHNNSKMTPEGLEEWREARSA